MKKEALEFLGNLDFSRRTFLKGAGAFLLGAMAGKMITVSEAEAKAMTEKWPWPYEKLDPAKTAELAYQEWYRVFCGAAVINSILNSLPRRWENPISPSQGMPLSS